MKFKIKVGGGIILRSIQVSDAEVALESLSDPDFVKWMSIGPQTLEGIREYYQYMINQAEMMQDLLFAIVYQGEMKGAIGLHEIDLENGVAEIGLWVSKKVWGHGVGTKAVQAICLFAKKELGLERLIYPAHEDNKRSKGVAEKVGGKFIGRKIRGGMPLDFFEITL